MVRPVHPWEKETVGRRLAVHALRRDYGFADIRDNSPSVSEVVRDGTNLVVVCRDAKGLYLYNADRSLRNNFEIAGADGKWQEAKVLNYRKLKGRDGKESDTDYIDGAEIVLSSDGVPEPVKARYMGKPRTTGTLYNEASLPLGPFETK